tara:strand:- start:4197 stop:4655 length:459 start_codon:yes stop_codon:yes gene_type:complete
MDQLDRIEWKLDQILAHLMGAKVASGEVAISPVQPSAPQHLVLSKLTTKQHATLQMLMAGWSNAEIGERMKVSANTVKGNVKSIANHCGVKTRMQILLTLEKEFEAVSEEDYIRMSNGLPKDWHENYVDPDPFFKLYGWKRRLDELGTKVEG